MSYRRKLLREIQRAVPRLQPGAYVVDVAHEDWCPRLHGGRCRCDPEVGRPRLVARMEVGEA